MSYEHKKSVLKFRTNPVQQQLPSRTQASSLKYYCDGLLVT